MATETLTMVLLVEVEATHKLKMCNKFFNQMAPFNGDKVRPRVTATAGGKMFSWLFDTGASTTCMYDI